MYWKKKGVLKRRNLYWKARTQEFFNIKIWTYKIIYFGLEVESKQDMASIITNYILSLSLMFGVRGYLDQ